MIRKRLLALFYLSTLMLSSPGLSGVRDFSVYNVASSIPMGTPGEVRAKDYYVNMGSNQGLRKGAFLEALRRLPSYDLIDQEFSRDLVFPIAVLKVIHVQSNAAICRLERMLPLQTTPSISPLSVMVGDFVRVSGSQEIPQSIEGQAAVKQSDPKAVGQSIEDTEVNEKKPDTRSESVSTSAEIKMETQQKQALDHAQENLSGELTTQKSNDAKINTPTADLVTTVN